MNKYFNVIFFIFFFNSIIFSLSLLTSYNYPDIFLQIQNGKIPAKIYPIVINNQKIRNFEFKIKPNIYYINTQTVLNNVLVDSSTPTYIYDYLPDFLTFDFHSENDSGAVHIQLSLKKEYYAFLHWNYTSAIFTPTFPHISYDTTFPKLAYILLKLQDHSFILGRTSISWGYWDYPVSISFTSPFFDHFSYFFEGNYFNYAFHLISINPILTSQEWEKQKKSSYNDRAKNLIASRFDFKPFENMSFSIGEMTIIGGRHLDIFVVNPISIRHNNYNGEYTNTAGIFQFNWTPFKTFNLAIIHLNPPQ